jgi:mannose-6-phosphate isomerase-like protein (cupin superfamily)
VRKGEGLSIKRRAGFEYLHKAPHLNNKLAEPFLVTAPYIAEEQDKPIHLSYHKGMEFDYILSGRMRFAYENHIEELDPGDTLMYDSGRGHGMIAIDGEPCTFLAIVMNSEGDVISRRCAFLSRRNAADLARVNGSCGFRHFDVHASPCQKSWRKSPAHTAVS